MSIPEGKVRKFVTLTEEEWEYLDQRVKVKIETPKYYYQRKGRPNRSMILSELIQADMKIKKAFGDGA